MMSSRVSISAAIASQDLGALAAGMSAQPDCLEGAPSSGHGGVDVGRLAGRERGVGGVRDRIEHVEHAAVDAVDVLAADVVADRRRQPAGALALRRSDVVTLTGPIREHARQAVERLVQQRATFDDAGGRCAATPAGVGSTSGGRT